VSLELLDLGATALGPLVEEVVFVGGASVVLWITDQAAPPPRPTKDVDVIVEVSGRLGYEQFSKRLREQGFMEDIESRVICRWLHTSSDLVLDAIPTNPAIFGFSNCWLAPAMPDRAPPSGRNPRLCLTCVYAFRSTSLRHLPLLLDRVVRWE
jgi:hypothetical protein